MRLAETVTLGTSTLERAAHLRGRPGEMAAEIAAGRASTILLWQGRPLIGGEQRDQLVRLAMDHPVLHLAPEEPVFLGLEEEGGLIFAHELSGWMPEGVDLAQLHSFADPSEQSHPDLPDGHRFTELRRVMTRLSRRDGELVATARGILNWHAAHGFCARCGAPSRSVQAGWQRQCDSCGAAHFPRTDPVVIMLITRGNRVLLGRSPGWPEGMYSLLAGFIEPGETIEAAVRREVWEEAGIRVGAVDYLASQPWPFPSSLMLGCRGEALSETIHVDVTELEDAMWLGREELADAFAGGAGRIMPARPGAIAHFLLRNWLADRLD